ncbi:MAG: DUF6265 family protein [Saprospiraceae bacterium]|nr:DUF6265 family protein [Saprospiraceae bacterium]
MNNIHVYIFILLSSVFISNSALCQPNTRTNEISTTQNELVGPAVASIEDVSWIEGQWKGKAFGGEVEEIWSAPDGGAMMGMFRLINDDQPTFYELMVIREINNSLILQLKHFHKDMKGWEEKDKTIDFPLIKMEKDKIWFDGLTFERISDKKMIVNVIIGEKEPEGVDFVYYRQ